MKLFRIFLFLILFSGCSAPQVALDYDQQIDFSHFKSYAIYPDMVSGLSQLDEKRVVTSLQKHLSQKGISTDSPSDFYINLYSEEYEEASRNTLGIGVGGGGGNLGVGVSGGIPIGGPETYLSLTFDIIDIERDELIWQAIVESKFNKNATPEKRQANLDRMVKKALESFPPDN